MSAGNKITELIKHEGKFSYSFEVTPDVSEEELFNLKVDPVFFSVTWHAKQHQCKDMNIGPVRIASALRSKQKHVLLHLSCDMLKADYLDQLLTVLQERNICNLFLILGESYDPNSSDFKTTSDLIKYIRNKTGQYFCIGIPGFPGCTDEKLQQIKEKIELGVDFIMTQALFDADGFTTLLKRCEEMDIKVPIIPGIFPFESLKQLHGFINMCKIKVSEDLLTAVNDKERMNKPCSEIIKLLLQDLNKKCNTNHFHFFTLNKLQNVQNYLEQIK